MKNTARRLVLLAAAGLAVAGQTAFAAHPGSDTPPTTEGEMEMEAMEVPEFAGNFTVEVTSDADGETVTANEVELTVEASGFELSCDWAGKPVNEEFGHYHVLLDHSLIDMECEETTVVSMQNVSPGEHTISVVPALNDHLEVLDNEVDFTFTYEPSEPLEELVDAEFDGAPAIRIVSPEPGETVSGEFDVVVEVENFNLNCDLYGKPGLLGYGHYHVNLDTMEGPMMGMMTMAGMACTETFHASTEGLEPGSTHTIIALLADNGHAPLMNPEAANSVEVTIG